MRSAAFAVEGMVEPHKFADRLPLYNYFMGLFFLTELSAKSD